MKFLDSMDKFGEYFKRLEFGKRNVYLSPLFFRSLICSSNCGACCQKYTMDYITKASQEKLKARYPEEYEKYFDFREYHGRQILSMLQKDNLENHCQLLDKYGRCSIHDANALSCQIEPIKFKLVKDRVYILKSFYRNSWQMTRVGGEKGCLCKFTSYTEEQYKNDLKVLKELNEVADIFGVKTVLPQIIDLLKKLGPNAKLQKKIPIQIIGMNRLDEWI
jgi:Fe-S-cluster containining protein